MPRVRVPLAENITTRDGSQSKDAKIVNCYIDKQGDRIDIVKRPGTSLYYTGVGAGEGQGSFQLGTTIYYIVNDVLYSNAGQSWVYNKPPVLGDQYQINISSDNTIATFKSTTAAYIFDGSTVTQIASNGGIISITMTNNGHGGTSIPSMSWGTPSTTTITGGFTSGGIAWNGTVYCVVGSIGGTNAINYCYTSPDGLTWTQRTLPSSQIWTGIEWNGSVFCAISGNNLSNVFATSPDGITWTLRIVPITTAWIAIKYGGGGANVFLAMGSNAGTAYIMTSPDGITWTQRTYPAVPLGGGGPGNYIGWNGGVFLIAQPGSGTQYATSPDGINWTVRQFLLKDVISPPISQTWFSIGSNGNNFIVTCSNTNLAVTSSDGVYWTYINMPSTAFWYINTVNSVYCIINANSNNAYISPNGNVWTLVAVSGAAGNYRYIGQNGSKFCLVGSAATVYSVVSTAPTAYGGTYALTFSGGSGSGVTGTYTIGSSGSVSSATITNPGRGYGTSAPTVSFNYGGVVGATANVNVSAFPSVTVPGLVYIDGAYYVMDTSSNIWGSSLGNPKEWLPLNQLQANASSGNPIGIVKLGNNLIAFKDTNLEAYYDAANPAPASPLNLIPNSIHSVGCVNGLTLQEIEGTVIFVSRSSKRGRSVSIMDGWNPKVISTPDIDRILNNDAMTNVYSFCVKISGHFFYILSLPASNITLAFDITTQQWSYWSLTTQTAPKAVYSLVYSNGIVTVTSYNHGFTNSQSVRITGAPVDGYNGIFNVFVIDANTFYYTVSYPIAYSSSPDTVITFFPSTGNIFAYGYTEGYFSFTNYLSVGNVDVIQHETNGNLYQLLPSNGNDYGNPIPMNVRTMIWDAGTSEKKPISRIELIGDKVNDSILIRHTDDDYQTFSSYRTMYLGNSRTQITRNGSPKRRAWEILYTGNNPLRVSALELTINE